jgi:hypothetical protein
MDGLTVGRMVHFVFEKQHRAAVITHVWGDNGTVNLHVFRDGSYPFGPETPTSVQYDEGKAENTWHWIEKA